MIDTNELADIVFDVQRREGYTFDPMEVVQVVQLTVRKVEMNGKDDSYVPILFENELRDHVMRERINEIGRMNLCARSVCTALV